MFRRTTVALVALAASIIAISLASAQTAPAWSLVFAPLDVQAGDTPALTVSIAPGATTSETVTLTFPPGLQVLDAQPSVGTYTDGVWIFQRPSSAPATLLLRFLVLTSAKTDDDVFVRATWASAVLKGAFIFHAPGDLDAPPSDPQIFLPLINHSP